MDGIRHESRGVATMLMSDFGDSRQVSGMEIPMSTSVTLDLARSGVIRSKYAAAVRKGDVHGVWRQRKLGLPSEWYGMRRRVAPSSTSLTRSSTSREYLAPPAADMAAAAAGGRNGRNRQLSEFHTPLLE